MSSLKGHVALVTGAGRGIGRAHALTLAGLGAQVVVCDIGVELDGSGRDGSVAAGVVQEITDRGGEAVADTHDISTFDGGAAAVRTGRQAFGKVDIVVNNAGLVGAASITDVTQEILMRDLAVHLLGSVGTVQAAWPMMAAQGWGRVVNTVSEEAFPARITPDARGIGLVYGPAKAAIWSWTLGLAAQALGSGITVNAVSPGAFTRMNAPMFEAAPTALDLDPVHVARVVAWLAGDEAQDVTGRVVHVAGEHRREYVMRRRADTDLVGRLDEALGAGGNA